MKNVLSRRNFFKTLAALLLPTQPNTTKPSTNEIQYIDCQISFPFSIENDGYSLQIYQYTLQLLKKMTENPSESMMIHMGLPQNTLYDSQIDTLLCNVFEKYPYLEYPTIKFLYQNQEIKTPDFSLICSLKYPEFSLGTHKGPNIKPSISSLFTTWHDYPPIPLDELIIFINADLCYYDVERPSKIFDIRKL